MLFLGSSIGNFAAEEIRAFLTKLREVLNPGDRVLIGFGLKKDLEVLRRAYNDSDGLSARFNLNVLRRINVELDADFDLTGFQRHADYNVRSGAVESALVSIREQVVTIGELGRSFELAAWEPIMLEYSYKFVEHEIDSHALAAGYSSLASFTDEKGWFVDVLWEVTPAR